MTKVVECKYLTENTTQNILVMFNFLLSPVSGKLTISNR